jgi:hypothetical protein
MFSAFELTGGYFNPSLATGLKLGCLQEDPASHFLVGKDDILRFLLHLLWCSRMPNT